MDCEHKWIYKKGRDECRCLKCTTVRPTHYFIANLLDACLRNDRSEDWKTGILREYVNCEA